jgi:hypothetical protein
MKNLNIKDFLNKKNSDTIVIFGSGPSIKNLKKEDFDILNKYDTLSFNMFCKTKIDVKFYILGEILDNYYKSSTHYKIKYKEVREDDISYFDDLSKYYKKTTFICWNGAYYKNKKNFMNQHLNNEMLLLDIKKHYTWHENGILTKKEYINKELYKDFFSKKKILLHQNVGLNSAIYLAYVMGYKNIIFAGVDLNNYKYAFDRNKFREDFIKEDVNTPHRSRDHAVSFINYLKNDINFRVYNNDSYLTNIIDTFK